MYEWNAVFERDEIVEVPDGQEEKQIRTIKHGQTAAPMGQDVVSSILNKYAKLGDLIQLQFRKI
jgi:hypothetical protein